MTGRRAPCALRAAGLITALGDTTAANAAGLASGDTSRLAWRDDLVPGRRYRFGSVDDAALAAGAPRTTALALAAANRIAREVSSARERCGPARLGVVLGTSTAGYREAEAAFRVRRDQGAFPRDFTLAAIEPGALAARIAAELGAKGPAWTISTACSSGAKALAAARELLLAGVCDAVVAGGADSLCATTASGFHALQALARDRSSPFSRRRDGLCLGEGAALFLLTRDVEGVCLLGSGEAQDAHHISAPDPEGGGARRAMTSAMQDAGVSANSIAYLNLHGTGTPANDAMEARAVAALFGAETPCSSTKPLVGHTLAAAGAVEAAFCWLLASAAEPPLLPPHRFDGDLDPALPAVHLVAPGERAATGHPLTLSASFGFGGSNAALVIGVPR